MDFNLIKTDVRENGIATAALFRPNSLNAFNAELIGELIRYFENIGDDETVRAVILTGDGEKAFAAGADIKEMSGMSSQEAKEFALRGQKLTNLIQHLGKPVVAAVNGYALGGGCEVALACHLRFASANAIFGQPEVGLGLIPGWGGTQRLARLIGSGLATELIISGKKIDAATAKNIGLVNEIYSQDELLDKTIEFLAGVRQQSPNAVSLSLEAINRGMNMTLAEGLHLEADLFGLAFSSQESTEGTQAFIEKRKPDFS
ncbi:MAG: enoyl-CoA hydratase/isomerase family protein [Candidatus Marinimicrobia bacterium]|nr:enoyl-CoA hydratase/isomerase family protein [Candidatus Neomarinimicrobiota bacterium]MCF7880283.1 enoyl-CoA hydratase/isomerase family protein [Candidatus Neomarinimicrobiota bacterium]